MCKIKIYYFYNWKTRREGRREHLRRYPCRAGRRCNLHCVHPRGVVHSLFVQRCTRCAPVFLRALGRPRWTRFQIAERNNKFKHHARHRQECKFHSEHSCSMLKSLQTVRRVQWLFGFKSFISNVQLSSTLSARVCMSVYITKVLYIYIIYMYICFLISPPVKMFFSVAGKRRNSHFCRFQPSDTDVFLSNPFCFLIYWNLNCPILFCFSVALWPQHQYPSFLPVTLFPTCLLPPAAFFVSSTDFLIFVTVKPFSIY